MRLRNPPSPASALLLTAMVLVAGLPAGTAVARTGADRESIDPPRLPIERTTTELVLIETYVEGADGRPVRGLTAGDFTLFVDGVPSPIASFESRTAAPEDRPAAERPLEVPAAEPAEPPRRFLLFFEDGTSAPEGMTAARHAVERFLTTSFLPTDQVGIAAYDRRLRILSDFTTDRSALLRTVDRSLREPGRISDLSVELRARREEIDRAIGEIDQTSIAEETRARASAPVALTSRQARTATQSDLARVEDLNHTKLLAASYGADEAPRLRAVLDALRTAVDSLAGWRGYKAVIFMGDGIPDNPALPYVERILSNHPDEFLLSQVRNLSLFPGFEALAQSASAAGVTIHALRTEGLLAGTLSETRAAHFRSSALEAIALNTGGLSSSSNDLLKALADFEASSRAYYVLGYVPLGPPDGRHHAVRVRCRESHARLRWRRGFTRLRSSDSLARSIQAAHLVPELFPQLPVDLSAIGGPAGRGGRIVDLVVSVPRTGVQFLPEQGTPTAHLEVGLVARDEGLNDTWRAARKVRVRLPDRGGLAAPDNLDFYYRTRLPSGTQTLTAVVRDDTAGVIGATRLSLLPAAPDAGGVVGLSLYSLRDSGLWIEVEGGDPDGTVRTADYAIGPALKSTFEPGESLACGFRSPDNGEGARTPLRVVLRQGNSILNSRTIEPGEFRPGGAVTVNLPSEKLPPGDYTVAVQEALPGGSVDRATAPLRIRRSGSGETPTATPAS